MTDFPTTPSPRLCTLAGYIDPAYRSQYQGGAIATRARFLRRRASYRLDYLTTAAGIMLLQDFHALVRGTVLPFTFTYPYPHTQIVATDTSPVIITTPYAHGYQTGNQVIITNANATINGTHQVTRLTAVDFSLNGVSGGGGAANGQVTRYFPLMRLSADEFPVPEPVLYFGEGRDNRGIIPMSLVLEETW